MRMAWDTPFRLGCLVLRLSFGYGFRLLVQGSGKVPRLFEIYSGSVCAVQWCDETLAGLLPEYDRQQSSLERAEDGLAFGVTGEMSGHNGVARLDEDDATSSYRHLFVSDEDIVVDIFAPEVPLVRELGMPDQADISLIQAGPAGSMMSALVEGRTLFVNGILRDGGQSVGYVLTCDVVYVNCRSDLGRGICIPPGVPVHDSVGGALRRVENSPLLEKLRASSPVAEEYYGPLAHYVVFAEHERIDFLTAFQPRILLRTAASTMT